LVKAKDKRRFRQNSEPKLKIQLEIKQNDKASTCASWVWPTGHTLATKTWPKLCFHGLIEVVGGSICSPYLCTLSLVWFFPINTGFRRLQGTMK